MEKLEINECDLKPEYASSVITVMKRMTTRISELPLTNEKVMSAIQDFNQFKEGIRRGWQGGIQREGGRRQGEQGQVELRLKQFQIRPAVHRATRIKHIFKRKDEKER